MNTKSNPIAQAAGELTEWFRAKRALAVAEDG